jgi:hypothetical protein
LVGAHTEQLAKHSVAAATASLQTIPRDRPGTTRTDGGG